ncbi:hypothetical protein BGW80DRAFT_1255400 [Lactifluus volemus]|nr:hypothetical protein BGW80DRAFT_1255400 [Lactifluus volemus]
MYLISIAKWFVAGSARDTLEKVKMFSSAQVFVPTLNIEYYTQAVRPTGTILDAHLHEQPQSVPYSTLVEASRHQSSSSSGHLQRMDTPSLNDNTLSMDISEVNPDLDSDSEEEHVEDDVPTQAWGARNPYSCGLCGKIFHAQKAVTRHLDDVHSEPKQCPEPKCQKVIIGKRKLAAHLERDHGHARKPGRKQQQIPNDAPL